MATPIKHTQPQPPRAPVFSAVPNGVPRPSHEPPPKAAAPVLKAAQAGKDFVVKELQTGADDVLKLAYGSMTLPPAKFFDLFTKVGEEYMKFVAKRMQAQAARMETLARCTGPEAIAQAEIEFFGKAAQDYAEQFDRMAETTHQVAAQATSEAGAAKGSPKGAPES